MHEADAGRIAANFGRMRPLVVQGEISGAEQDAAILHRALEHQQRLLAAMAMGGHTRPRRPAQEKERAESDAVEAMHLQPGPEWTPWNVRHPTGDRLRQRGRQRPDRGGRLGWRVEAGKGAGAIGRRTGFGTFGHERATDRSELAEDPATARAAGDMAKDQQLHSVRQGARGAARQRFDGSVPLGHCRTCLNIGTTATNARRDRITSGRRDEDDCVRDVMRSVFLVEPYGHPRPLGALIGAVPEIGPRPAVLSGHAIGSDASGLALGATRRPGVEAPGIILTPTEAERARIDFWMAGISAKPLVAKARGLDGHLTMVDTFLLPPGTATLDWRAEEWAGEWCATVAEAIGEVLRHLGLVDVEHIGELLPGVGYRALARARGAVDETPARLRSGLAAAGDAEPLRLDLPYTKYFSLEEHHLRHRRFDGAMSPPILRAVFASGDAVAVLPFDPRTGNVLLIEQFRAGPHARRDPRPWCLETVAGRCDPRESPETTARREAREEAGLELGRIEPVVRYYPSPGVLAEHITAFVGEADLAGAGGRHGLDTEDEDIRALVLPLDDALAAIESGEANNSPLLITLLWLEKHRGRLTAAWS